MSKEHDRFLRISAWDFLLCQGICTLPIDVLSLLPKNGWAEGRYSQLAQRTGLSVAGIRTKYHPQGFVFWSETEERFWVCYDETLPVPTVRWQVMQDIAHIVLGHVSRDFPRLSRLDGARRTLSASEALSFTRRVLCPSIVLHELGALTPERIAHLCGIPRQAAEYRSRHMQILEARGAFCTDPMEVDVERQFAPFIQSYVHK